MGEYAPRDSRNITGVAATPDGHWTNTDGKPPLANGEPEAVRKGDHQVDPRADDDGEVEKEKSE